MKTKNLSHSQIENILKELNPPQIISDWLPAADKKEYENLCSKIRQRNEIAEKAKEIHDTMILQGAIASGRYTPFQTGRGTDIYNFVPDEPLPTASPTFNSEQRTRRIELGKLIEQLCNVTLELKPLVDTACDVLRRLADKENSRLWGKYDEARDLMIQKLEKLAFPKDVCEIFVDHSKTVQAAAGPLDSQMASSFWQEHMPSGGLNISGQLHRDRLYRPPAAGAWRKAAELAKELLDAAQEDEA